ncbi:efflux RND transporter permease subunit, partial [Escherichia coli]|nr:efflux RND transporter permease subunit [Escherichia coli]
HLNQLPNINQIHSSNSKNNSLIFIIFQNKININSTTLNIQTTINSTQTNLPSKLNSPIFQKTNPNNNPIITITLTSQTQSTNKLYNITNS